MRGRALLMFFTATMAWSAVVEPPLPEWDAQERDKMIEDGWMAGGLLLNGDPIPEEGEGVEALPSIEDPTPEELSQEPVDERVVAEDYLAAYFEAKPSASLVDPQGLIPSRQRKDLEAFLEYHSGDSSIDLFIYVFGSNQIIPSDVREEEVVERLYSVGKPAAVVYYYVGAPQRSTMYLSPVLTDAVSAAEQRRALESSVMKAFGSTDGFEQLQAFLVQMSIRIYWMERMREGTAEETMESIPEGRSLRMGEKREGKSEGALKFPEWMRMPAYAAAAVTGGLLVLCSAWMCWRTRARYRFPEFEVEPRLGGSHAAGIGAVISFGSAAIPPAMQRKQVPDYMRRA